jgi:hypothetical protein
MARPVVLQLPFSLIWLRLKLKLYAPELLGARDKAFLPLLAIDEFLEGKLIV